MKSKIENLSLLNKAFTKVKEFDFQLLLKIDIFAVSSFA